MPKMIFDDNFPTQHEHEVDRLLSPLLFLVPDIETIKIWFSSDSESEAAIEVKRRYHIAHLTLHADFFATPFEEKERTLLHELVHVRVDGYVREVAHVLGTWVPQEIVPYVYARLEDVEEEMVDAIALGIQRALNAGETVIWNVTPKDSSFAEMLEDEIISGGVFKHED